MMFFHHENPHEATNGFVKAVTLQIFSKFSNVKFSPHCVPRWGRETKIVKMRFWFLDPISDFQSVKLEDEDEDEEDAVKITARPPTPPRGRKKTDISK